MNAQKQVNSSVATLEKLFNDVFQAPDLKKEVLDYIQSGVIEAHQLLMSQNTAVSDSTSALGFEEKRQLENLLYRDLPNLVSDYTSLDVTYRNEKALKNNRTHRENLIESLRFVLAKMADLKNSAFTTQDTKANTIPQILEAKYGQVETEIAPLQSGYNWNALKSTLPQKHLENSGFIKPVSTVGEVEQKIALVDGKVQYRAKNVKAAALLLAKKCKAQYKKFYYHRQVYGKIKFLKANKTPLGIMAFVLIGGFLSVSQVLEVKHAKSTLGNVIYELNTKTRFSPDARDAGMAQLVKMGNPNSLYHEDNLSVKVDDKQKLVNIRYSSLNRWACENLHDYLNDATIHQGHYQINGQNIQSGIVDKDQYAQDSKACSKMFGNEISISDDMRTYDEREGARITQQLQNEIEKGKLSVEQAQQKMQEALAYRNQMMMQYYQPYQQQSYHVYHSYGSSSNRSYSSPSSSSGYSRYHPGY